MEEPKTTTDAVVGKGTRRHHKVIGWWRQPVSRLVFALLFAIAGVIALQLSRASTPLSACTKQFSATSNISGIVNSLRPGDVACLSSGDYGSKGTRANWTVSGTAQNQITIQANPGAIAKIHGMSDVAGSYITVNNVIFDGPTGNINPADTPTGEDVMVWAAGSDLTFNHVEVRNGLWHAGIYVSGDRVSVLGSYIHDIGPFNDPTQAQAGGQANNIDHGVYWGSGSGGRIMNTVLEHNLAYGIQAILRQTVCWLLTIRLLKTGPAG